MRVTSVNRCLDEKLTLFGYEVVDLISIFIVLSLLNVLFGKSEMKLLLVWVPTSLLALVLRYGKRGRPDRFLTHWIRFQSSPGVYSAFPENPHAIPFPRGGHS